MSVQNILRTIRKSTIKPVQAAVKGTIPKWVNGSLYRNGPGQFEFDNKYYNHLFDGAACVNKFEIKDGNVFYSNRLLESAFYKESIKQNAIVGGFGSVAEKSNVFTRVKNFFTLPPITDNTNVTIYPYANKHLYAMTEINRINRLDPEDLSIMSVTDIQEYFKVKTNIAHPQTLRDGSWINMGLYVDKDRKGHYVFFKYQGGEEEAKADHLYKNGKILASVPSSHADGASYFHSFGVTENYIIFLESPIKTVFKERLMGAIMKKPMLNSFTTDMDFPTRIHVVNMNTGEVLPQKFTTEAQFSFHHINAYEKKVSEDCTNLVVDVASFSTGEGQFNLHNLTYKALNEGHLQNTDKAKAVARRITVPLSKSNKPGDEVYCDISTLNSEPMEFPTLNYGRSNQLPYKYFFCTNSLYAKPFTVMKINVEDPADTLKFEYSDQKDALKNIVPSEPIFVENPNPQSEDDGVLLVQVLSDDTDYLSILDAKDMTEIARADLPKEIRSTFTFHGFFADRATMF